jgi:hypothetical protein
MTDGDVAPGTESAGSEEEEKYFRIASIRPALDVSSNMDLHQGYVRLKVETENVCEAPLEGATISVGYDPAVLRLDHVEPGDFTRDRDTIVLGRVDPGERRDVSFLFDPEACQLAAVESRVLFVDDEGRPRYKLMRERTALVSCPALNMGTRVTIGDVLAMVRGGPDVKESRILRFPRAMSAIRVLRYAKMALQGKDLQMVWDVRVREPSYEAELWYYAEVEDGGGPLVVRMSVYGEDRVLEFFAAGFSSAAIAGLITSIREDFNRILRENYAGRISADVERDPQVVKGIRERQLLVERVGEGEIEPS